MTERQRHLVTGGAGFIGRHLATALLARGHFVRVVDDLSRGDRASVPAGCEWIEGSLLDEVLCREACEGIDGVFHVAAAIVTPARVDAVEYFMERNVRATQNLLIAARDAHVRKLVYSASRTAYGGLAPPRSAAMSPECLTPYALSKLVGEQMCALFTRLYGLPTLSLRYTDVYGPGQPTDGPYATLVPRLLEQRRAGREPSAPADGSREQDLVHVDDVVEANWCAYQASASGIVLDVCSGRPRSVKSIVDLVASGTREERPSHGAGATGTQPEEAACRATEATRMRIGWTPRTPLERGLRALLDVGSENAASTLA